MATLAELITLNDDDALRNKVAMSAMIKADAILVEATPSAPRLQWAQDTLRDPLEAGRDLYWAVIGANNSASLPAISGASDAQINTNVGDAVDVFYP